MSSSKTIFYKELKQTPINIGFSNYIDDAQIKHRIKNFSQQNKYSTQSTSIYPTFYQNQMLYTYKVDENMLKTLIKRNMLPIDPNKK